MKMISWLRCEINVSPRDLWILNREYCGICSERFVQRLPIYFGKKSIISGKNNSLNVRLAVRIVLQLTNSFDAIEGFLISMKAKLSFFLLQRQNGKELPFPCSFDTTLLPSYHSSVESVGESPPGVKTGSIANVFRFYGGHASR